jgi:hypothetical protein
MLLPLIWILIAGFFIDAINIDEIIGIHEMIHEEYDGESISNDLDNQDIDLTTINNGYTHEIIQSQNKSVSYSIQWIDSDSPSIAASVIFEGKEPLLILNQQSTQYYNSTFIPVSTPVTLGKLLI